MPKQIRCTGQIPASSLLSVLSPSSISSSGTVLVRKTLQILDPNLPNIYALGDVAETGGVRMGRAAGMQGSLVASNILRAIRGQQLKNYKPLGLLESGIDLTLGLVRNDVSSFLHSHSIFDIIQPLSLNMVRNC